MAEAVFASEQVKKLPSDRIAATLALADTVISRLAEDLFMRNGPGNTSDGNGKNEQCSDLPAQRHFDKEVFPLDQVAPSASASGIQAWNWTKADSASATEGCMQTDVS
jgi:hypothetical protein